MNNQLKICNAILAFAIKTKCSIIQACSQYNQKGDYFYDFLRRGIHRALKNGKVSKEEFKDITKLYENYQKTVKGSLKSKNKSSNKKSEKPQSTEELPFDVLNLINPELSGINLYDDDKLTQEEKELIEYDAYKDDAYDERSIGEALKDENGNIIEYHYKILIRDQNALEGKFTREEMDKIYRLYSNLDGAGLTLRAVSREFHNLNFRDFKRILRAFNITKSSVPVAPHILLEREPNDVVEIILRNKENIVLKKLDNERSKLIEKYLLDAQRRIVRYERTDEWISDVVDRYFERKPLSTPIKRFDFEDKKSNKEKVESGNPTICIFGDIHYGKRFDNPILGRAYNKDIAHERVMQISQSIIDDYKSRNSQEIIMICMGDLVESVMENGMHAGHLYEMDLFQDEQIFFAVDSIKQMIHHVLKNTNCPIQFHAVQGNHDRIGIGRDEDKNRTAGKIICKILERELTKESNKIKFFIPKNNLLRIVTGKIMMFVQHGDSGLSKKKPSEIVSLQGEPGCYSVLLQGHWHSLKSEEGNNFLAMKVPSVASTDKFILEELGNNNLSGFIIGHQPIDCYGFNYSKITLR